MKSITKLLLKYKLYLLAVLGPLGFWGAGLISLIDSASIPVPMEIIMAGYVWADKRHFYLYTLMAAIGAAIGGLVPFLLGRAGGEIFLLRRIDRTRYEQMLQRFQKQEFLAMLIPSMLPPPTPWKLFVFGAGVFEMPISLFMLAVFLGRFVRFTIEGLLVIRYGPQMVQIVTQLAKQHTRSLLATLGLLLVILVIWVMRKAFRKRSPATA